MKAHGYVWPRLFQICSVINAEEEGGGAGGGERREGGERGGSGMSALQLKIFKNGYVMRKKAMKMQTKRDNGCKNIDGHY